MIYIDKEHHTRLARRATPITKAVLNALQERLDDPTPVVVDHTRPDGVKLVNFDFAFSLEARARFTELMAMYNIGPSDLARSLLRDVWPLGKHDEAEVVYPVRVPYRVAKALSLHPDKCTALLTRYYEELEKRKKEN